MILFFIWILINFVDIFYSEFCIENEMDIVIENICEIWNYYV